MNEKAIFELAASGLQMVSTEKGKRIHQSTKKYICVLKKNNEYFERHFWGIQDKTPGSLPELQDRSVPPSLIQQGKHQQKVWLSLGAREAALLWLGRAWSSPTGSPDLQRAAGKYYCGWFLGLYFLRDSSDTSRSYSQIRWPESLFHSHCIAGETIKKCIE